MPAYLSQIEDHPSNNATLKAPKGTEERIGDLECELQREDDGGVVTYSRWQMDDVTRAMIAAGAHMRMGVWQHPIPPLQLAVEGPPCTGCEIERTWDGEKFVCNVGDCPESLIEAGRTNASPASAPEAEVRRDFTPGEEVPPHPDGD
jgi:hypothetical protein